MPETYRASTSLTRRPRRHARYDRVAEAAAPVLDRLCRKISWPSDLMVPAGDRMLIAESSQTHTPFLINAGGIGYHVNWLLTAVGRVYLAHCPSQERDQLLQRLRKTGRPEDRLAHEPKRFERILAETRQRGRREFYLCDPSSLPLESSDRAFDPLFRTRGRGTELTEFRS